MVVAGAGDHALAWLAARQFGVVSYSQLAACGLARSAIRHRHAVGRLHLLLRGVYLVGHRAAPPGATQAAAVRFTWRRVTRHPEAVAATLARALAGN